MENYGGSGMMRFLRDQPPTHYTFEVNCVSMMVKMKQDKYVSGVFGAAGYKWKLIFYPNGNKEANVQDHISLYLAIEDTDSLPETWEVEIDFKLFVFNQTTKKFLNIQDVADPIKRFHDGKRQWGFPKLLELEAFKDPTNGYLVNDRVIFGAEVFTAQALKKSECFSVTTEDDQYGLDGRDVRHCVPRNGSNLQNGLFTTFRDLAPAHFLFSTESFSALCSEDSDVYESDIFERGGFKWRLCLHPKGNQKYKVQESLSLYLKIVETNDLSKNWEVFATFTFFIYDEIKDRFLTIQDGSVKRFHEIKKEWGFDNLISIKDFEDASNGFLVSDGCSFGAELLVVKHEGKIVEKAPPKIVGTTTEVSSSSCKEWETLVREHCVYASLFQSYMNYNVKECIGEAIVASSTDNFLKESIHNTLERLDRIGRRPSYWSSKGQKDRAVPETLLYKLVAELCVVTEINIQPFQAYFRRGEPIYSATSLRFRMGYAKTGMDDCVSDSGLMSIDDKFVWTYTSQEFAMAQENSLQKFRLPEPVLCIGGYVLIELLGRVKKDEMDGLYYLCISYVQVIGKSFPRVSGEPADNFILKALS